MNSNFDLLSILNSRNMKVLTILFSLLFFYTATFAQGNSLHESQFVRIGGIEQWVTIDGEDLSKPLILFIHGGPGSTMSPYANAMYAGWEKDFILVNWDQRGAGKTYGRNIPTEVDVDFYIENPLTVEQMVEDGIEVTRYLLKKLNKEKLVLVGTSWGSILGAKMALANPELFHAYIGHAQFVNFEKNIFHAYEETLSLVKASKDEPAKEKLEVLGKPPYDNAQKYGQLLRIVKKYEADRSVAAPEFWWKIAAEYDNEKDNKARYDGDDYSFLNLVGHQKLGIKSMVSEIDFMRDGLVFEVPVFLIQGQNDILTSMELNKVYFDKIIAPEKQYAIAESAGHGHNQEIVNKQLEFVKKAFSGK